MGLYGSYRENGTSSDGEFFAGNGDVIARIHGISTSKTKKGGNPQTFLKFKIVSTAPGTDAKPGLGGIGKWRFCPAEANYPKQDEARFAQFAQVILGLPKLDDHAAMAKAVGADLPAGFDIEDPEAEDTVVGLTRLDKAFTAYVNKRLLAEGEVTEFNGKDIGLKLETRPGKTFCSITPSSIPDQNLGEGGRLKHGVVEKLAKKGFEFADGVEFAD